MTRTSPRKLAGQRRGLRLPGGPSLFDLVDVTIMLVVTLYPFL